MAAEVRDAGLTGRSASDQARQSSRVESEWRCLALQGGVVARLVIYSSGIVNRTVDLTGQNIRIGRAKGNDVVLFDPAQVVSRFHAELRFEDGRYILLDLNSANGTWVLDHRIQRIVFDAGTVAEIGDYRLVLEADTEATTAPPSARLDFESRRISPPRDVSGTLVISPEPAPAEPAPPTPVPTPRVSPRPVDPPAPGSPPAPPTPAPPAERAPAEPVPFSIPRAAPAHVDPGPVAPVPVPPAPDPRPVRPSPSLPGVSATDSSPAARRARQPRALVVSVVALGILVVGVTGIIVGGEFLLPSPDYPKTKAEDRRSPSQAATSAAPVQPPAVAAPATAEAPIAETPVATPPATPPPPVASTPRSTARSGGRVGPAPPAQPAGARLQRTYEQAIAALQARDFAGAIALFEQIEREQPGLLDVPARLAASREALRESRHAAAQAALAAGVGAEQRGDLVEAQKEYQRALDADPACGGDEALRRVRAQMKTLGNEALKRAKTFDALSRTEDAIAQYERAVQLLPPDDPNRKTAKERLDILRASFIKEPRR